MEMEDVCYTREMALEKAIAIERESFELYKNAYMIIKDRRTKDLVKEIALEELEHKYILEKAFFQETVFLHEESGSEAPVMDLSLLLKQEPLKTDATAQDVMIYAVHDKKRIVDFYQKMAVQCSGAPMEDMFKRLFDDEKNHLAMLEEVYENYYMKDN